MVKSRKVSSPVATEPLGCTHPYDIVAMVCYQCQNQVGARSRGHALTRVRSCARSGSVLAGGIHFWQGKMDWGALFTPV